MATVYLARAEVVQGVTRDYALKVMHPHLRGDPEWATHLLHEAKIAARIRHPNVVPVVEAGDDPLGLYLVLDYIEGDTLSGLSRALSKQNNSLPMRVSGRILLDALAGLHAAHELLDETGNPVNLVHRDFSPQNILVGVDGIGRLTDFGIAKAQGSQVTATGILKGKISYMSPEQARGSRVDRRCDVWAAGVIAWELLAARRLYPKKNETETLLAIVQKEPPLLRSVNPDLSPALEAAVARALTPNLDQRCPDAQALVRQLEPAWRDQFGLADAAEVASLVRDTVATSAARRRSQIARVLAARSGDTAARDNLANPEGVLTPSDAASRDSLVLQDPADPEKESATGFQAVTSTQRKRKVALGAGAVALLAVAGVAGIAAVANPFRAGTKPATDHLPTSTASSASAPASAPSPTATSTAEPQPTPEEASLIIRSNRKLTKLRLGRRSIDVSPPVKQVEVKLVPSEIGEELDLEATSTDNDTTTATVGKTQGSVVLEFKLPTRHVPRPTRKPKPKPVDELAPTPFKKSGSK